MRQYKQGFYKLRNPKVYVGDIDKVIYRSSYELKFFRWIDTLACIPNTPILAWGSEELKIPYFLETDGKMHNYFPDIIMKIRERDGNIIKYVVEIKPFCETIPPKNPKTKSYHGAMLTYVKNQTKWHAADIFCKSNDMKFKVLTEHELGIKI